MFRWHHEDDHRYMNIFNNMTSDKNKEIALISLFLINFFVFKLAPQIFTRLPTQQLKHNLRMIWI